MMQYKRLIQAVLGMFLIAGYGWVASVAKAAPASPEQEAEAVEAEKKPTELRFLPSSPREPDYGTRSSRRPARPPQDESAQPAESRARATGSGKSPVDLRFLPSSPRESGYGESGRWFITEDDEDREKVWAIFGGVDWHSKYIFRGQTRNDGSVIQPYAGFSVLGFNLGVWTNVDINSKRAEDSDYELTELNLSLAYTHAFGPLNITAGYIAYYLRDLLTRRFIVNDYDSGTGQFLPSVTHKYHYDEWYWTQEVFLRAFYSLPITDRVSADVDGGVYYDFDKDQRGTFKYGPGNDPNGEDRVAEELPDNRRVYAYTRLATPIRLVEDEDYRVIFRPSILLHYTNEEGKLDKDTPENNAYEGWASLIGGLALEMWFGDYLKVSPFINYSLAIDNSERDYHVWQARYTDGEYIGRGGADPVTERIDYYRDEFWGGVSIMARY